VTDFLRERWRNRKSGKRIRSCISSGGGGSSSSNINTSSSGTRRKRRRTRRSWCFAVNRWLLRDVEFVVLTARRHTSSDGSPLWKKLHRRLSRDVVDGMAVGSRRSIVC